MFEAAKMLAETVVKEVLQPFQEKLSPKFFESMPTPEKQYDLNIPIIDIDTGENSELNENKKGGAYEDLPTSNETERHHIPADSASKLDKKDGPAIVMDKDDHRQTASCGNSKEAQEYREKQKELIDAGKFEEALQMDIDDIKEKFGDKYDDAIAEALDYAEQLKEEGKI